MTKKLRVAMVTPSVEVGGVETFLLRLGTALKEFDIEADVITTELHGEWFDKVEDAGMVAKHIGGHGVSYPALHAYRVGHRLAAWNYDAILLNHTPYGQASISLIPDHVPVIPILHSTHDSIFQLAAINRLAWNAAVAISPKVLDLARKKISRKPIVLIPSAVDAPSEEVFTARVPHQHPFRLIFVGRLSSTKGAFRLPTMIRQCLDRGLDVTISLVGDSCERQYLEKITSDNDVLQRATCHGKLSNREIYQLLLQSHALLFPSLFEGLGLVALEAQACGCVPIATRLPGVTDFTIAEGTSGFLADADDVSGFVDAIDQLYHNAELWSAMSQAGYTRVLREFSLAAMSSAYHQLIMQAINGEYPLFCSRRQLSPIDSTLFPWGNFEQAFRLWPRT